MIKRGDVNTVAPTRFVLLKTPSAVGFPEFIGLETNADQLSRKGRNYLHLFPVTWPLCFTVCWKSSELPLVPLSVEACALISLELQRVNSSVDIIRSQLLERSNDRTGKGAIIELNPSHYDLSKFSFAKLWMFCMIGIHGTREICMINACVTEVCRINDLHQASLISTFAAGLKIRKTHFWWGRKDNLKAASAHCGTNLKLFAPSLRVIHKTWLSIQILALLLCKLRNPKVFGLYRICFNFESFKDKFFSCLTHT